MQTVTAAALAVPGARIHYEVRGSGPLVALVGAPMRAESFAPLADLLAADHTVLTTDPRGVHRSPLDDPEAGSTPQERADDLQPSRSKATMLRSGRARGGRASQPRPPRPQHGGHAPTGLQQSHRAATRRGRRGRWS